MKNDKNAIRSQALMSPARSLVLSVFFFSYSLVTDKRGEDKLSRTLFYLFLRAASIEETVIRSMNVDSVTSVQKRDRAREREGDKFGNDDGETRRSAESDGSETERGSERR